MLTRLDNLVIWLVVVIVVPGVVTLAAIEGPKFERCTQVALDVLEGADPQERYPSASLIQAIKEEHNTQWLPLSVTRYVISASQCHGPPSLGWGDRVWSQVVLAWWFSLRFRDEDLVALYAAKIYLGHNAYGFATASRSIYGRELGTLSVDELRCLARRTRAPSAPQLACNGR